MRRKKQRKQTNNKLIYFRVAVYVNYSFHNKQTYKKYFYPISNAT